MSSLTPNPWLHLYCASLPALLIFNLTLPLSFHVCIYLSQKALGKPNGWPPLNFQQVVRFWHGLQGREKQRGQKQGRFLPFCLMPSHQDVLILLTVNPYNFRQIHFQTEACTFQFIHWFPDIWGEPLQPFTTGIIFKQCCGWQIPWLPASTISKSYWKDNYWDEKKSPPRKAMQFHATNWPFKKGVWRRLKKIQAHGMFFHLVLHYGRLSFKF